MLVVCGEAVLDLISDGTSRGYQARAGGSPLNVAVGTARLGLPTAFLARFGSGQPGRLLSSHASESGVDLRLSVRAAEPAMLALVSLEPTGEAGYDFYIDGTAESGWQPGDLPDPLPENVQALNVGSISSWRAPSADLIAKLVLRERRRGAVLISFDPNLRPVLVEDAARTRTRIEQLVALVHLVKVSVEDLGWLYPGQQPDALARRWAHAGPALVVLTDGANGVRAYRPDRQTVSQPAHGVAVVDTVGAGDAFTAGLLAAIAERNRLSPVGLRSLDDDDLEAILTGAAMVAALTCTPQGADPPSRKERNDALGRTSRVGPPGKR